MIESKLISILKCFSADEIKSFEKFIISPYFSMGRDVSGLFSQLKKYYPEFNSDKLERENIFRKLSPSENFNETKLKNLVSTLTNLAEQFLVHNSLRTDEIGSGMRLAKHYLKSNNDKLFFSTLKTLENKISERPFFGIENISQKIELLKLKEKFYIQKNKFSESIPLRLCHSEYSAISFLIIFLKKLKDTVILPIFYNTSFDNTILEAINKSTDIEKMIQELELRNYNKLWVIEIYYNIYKAIRLHKEASSETCYEKAKELFYKNIHEFTQIEKFYIFDSFATYCTMRDPENQKYTRESFEVYNRMLEENVYSSDSKDPMGSNLYGNIVLWSLDVFEYDWLEMFIERYSEKLKAEHRENMTHFAKANLFFVKGDFEKALYHISRVNQDFLLYKIQVRNLKFKIYYELNLFEQAYSLVDSYRHFLSVNNEIHETFKLRALDFINLYSKLLKSKADGTVSDIDILNEKVKTMLGYELRPWLTEKVNELMKKGAK